MLTTHLILAKPTDFWFAFVNLIHSAAGTVHLMQIISQFLLGLIATHVLPLYTSALDFGCPALG